MNAVTQDLNSSKDLPISDDILPFIPKGKLGTPHTVLLDLMARVDGIAEIYVVIKDKDGTSHEYINGSLSGLCFAMLVLQNYSLRALKGELDENGR